MLKKINKMYKIIVCIEKKTEVTNVQLDRLMKCSQLCTQLSPYGLQDATCSEKKHRSNYQHQALILSALQPYIN